MPAVCCCRQRPPRISVVEIGELPSTGSEVLVLGSPKAVQLPGAVPGAAVLLRAMSPLGECSSGEQRGHAAAQCASVPLRCLCR